MAGARKPPPQDLEAAWARFLVTREPEARTLLIEGHRHLVTITVGKMTPLLFPGMEPQDAMTWGFIALVQAVDRYNPLGGCTFRGYALNRIRWAIKDYIRSEMRVPRHLREEIEALQAEADEDDDRLFELTLRASVRGIISIEARMEGVDLTSERSSAAEPYGPGDIQRAMLDPAEGVDDQTIREAVASRLREAIESLGDPQATVLVQNMLLGRPLREIGVELGLHRTRISQIKGEGLQRLTLILAEDRELLLGE